MLSPSLQLDKRLPSIFSILFFLFFGISAVGTELSPGSPAVDKIEPPSWWIKLTPDVMVMLTGKNLQKARATCDWPGISIREEHSSASGNYLFLNLNLASDVKAGAPVFYVTTSEGQTMFRLPLAPRKAVLGRNQGLDLNDVIYLIMPDRFANGDRSHARPATFRRETRHLHTYHGGDLLGIRQHLSYLRDLGITTLWITPVVKNGAPSDYHGYGAVDLYDVDPHLGTLQDYLDLVEAAHQAQMKICFDVVPNHVGPRNPWVTNPPDADWFHGTVSNHLSCASPLPMTFYGNALKNVGPMNFFESLEDPHATKRMQRNLTEGWFPGFRSLPDLNTENPLVVKYLIQNSIWWAEISGLDVYRVDTFPYVSRRFWEQWNTALLKLYPHLSAIGEVFHPDPTVTSFFVGGRTRWDGIDTHLTTVFDFPMYFSLRDVLLRNAPVGEILNILRQDSLYPQPERLVTFFGNHDTPRFAGVDEPNIQKLKLAFGMLLTLRGIPEIYYGDEIGLVGGGDPDNRRDFPGGWPDDPQDAFTAAGRTKNQEAVFDFVKTLLSLRRQHAALKAGSLFHLAATDGCYVFMRQSGPDNLVIALNNGAANSSLSVPLSDTPAANFTGGDTLVGDGRVIAAKGTLDIWLPESSISIFQLH